MNVLVTGASGQLGRSLRDSAVNSPHHFIFSDLVQDECTVSLDIADPVAVAEAVKAYEADVIVNCAAYTDVNRAESDAGKAALINSYAPSVLAGAARDAGALLMHISTDYVFDGNACVPYREDDPTSPVSVYGKTKLDGELNIKESGCRYMIFRTAWLYSNYGKNFYKTMEALTADKPQIKVVADQVGTPTFAGDLADTLVEIINNGMLDKTGIYHFTNEGVCSWYDFAKEICDSFGHLCNVIPCRTEDFPTPAARPHYSVLDKTRVKNTFGIDIPHWKDSLKVCVMDFKK